jgi:hypothetical protein
MKEKKILKFARIMRIVMAVAAVAQLFIIPFPWVRLFFWAAFNCEAVLFHAIVMDFEECIRKGEPAL